MVSQSEQLVQEEIHPRRKSERMGFYNFSRQSTQVTSCQVPLLTDSPQLCHNRASLQHTSPMRPHTVFRPQQLTGIYIELYSLSYIKKQNQKHKPVFRIACLNLSCFMQPVYRNQHLKGWTYIVLSQLLKTLLSYIEME